MKTLLVKFGLILVFLAFLDYVIIAIMGCVSCIFGATENYFCNTYCWIVKTFALVTLGLWMIWFGYSIIQLKRKAQ